MTGDNKFFSNIPAHQVFERFPNPEAHYQFTQDDIRAAREQGYKEGFAEGFSDGFDSGRKAGSAKPLVLPLALKEGTHNDERQV